MGKSVRELADRTPAGRDRYVDLLRVASLGTVVAGHWLMAAVSADGDVGNLLAVVPRLQILTWALQVMPVFFFVGGFSHALSYRSLRRKHPEGAGLYSVFVRARLQRLLRPTMVFVAVWGAAALAIQLLGGQDGLTGVALRLVAQPLWFIGIYLAMVAFTPALLKLHERHGWAAFGALASAAVGVDLLRFAFGVPYVEFLNFAFVWLAVHQLGFLRADGRIRRPAVLAAAGLAGAAALVAFGPYPLSMVGMPGEKVSNMAPPTLALLAHGLWLVGAVELLRGPGARLVARPRVWRGVVAANGMAMTAFLWHLTAMLGVYGAMLALDLPLPAPASAGWWAQVPPRFAAAAGLTALCVAAFRAFERPARGGGLPAGSPGRLAGPAAAVGVTLSLLGILGLSMVGFAGLLEGRTALLVAVRVSAPTAVVMALAGWLLVEAAGRARAGATTGG
ncbi:acyltransferase [Streptomyces agglomeratus]|uniref:Acyltransferase n=1 Tax=Streptomyces agglomeratus TaxID=285458 RepID=A0A1E5PAJ5_9ACTN|nr:acyltransferase [Streptomyces agglomeratus]OEJ26487.1 acyltransferase [Streptomyces agglomeratus]OEJ39447.1 acyltransferase [Streptomyces agglomeratus]OEJ46169.1 acyltransferase [Streptomyces agglomeratus]OEJ51971.1 acyltransferase [Streptomyces agglomeratus]